MAKKKYKFKLGNLEVSSSDVYDFAFLEQILNRAAIYERKLGHLAECEKYQKIADSIIPTLGEQI